MDAVMVFRDFHTVMAPAGRALQAHRKYHQNQQNRLRSSCRVNSVLLNSGRSVRRTDQGGSRLPGSTATLESVTLVDF